MNDHSRNNIALSVRGIKKSFGGVEVLHGIDLDATKGRVLALLGENGAGKSTLVKIISGDYEPDAGEIYIGDQRFSKLTPISAGHLGIRMIYQEINDAGTLSVAENIFLGRLVSKHGFVQWRKMRREAQLILDELEVDINPNALMSTLRVGERQVIEIARALSDKASVLILDEPTAALSGDEVDTLFDFIDRLREKGTAMIYITHRLDELRRVADDVVVLRDGNLALTSSDARNMDRSVLIEAMVGSKIDDFGRPVANHIPPGTQPFIELRHAESPGNFEDVNLTVSPGEVVALYGKVGSGISEVAEAAFGLQKITMGDISIEGGPQATSPRNAISIGVGLLPADRKREGAFLGLSSGMNLVAPFWSGVLGGSFWVNGKKERTSFEKWRTALRIRVSESGSDKPISLLSGGNQQKVLLARWLNAGSKVLVLLEPTRGVDVGARQEIYAVIRQLAEQGVAVLISTSDYEEVVQVADRAVVMSAGRITRDLDYHEVSVVALTDASGG